MNRSLGDAAWLTAEGARQQSPEPAGLLMPALPTTARFVWETAVILVQLHREGVQQRVKGQPCLPSILHHWLGQGQGGTEQPAELDLNWSPAHGAPRCTAPVRHSSRPKELAGAPPTLPPAGGVHHQPRCAPSQLNPRRPGHSTASTDSRGRTEMLRAGTS